MAFSAGISIVVAVALLAWFFIEKSQRKRRVVRGGIDRTVTLAHTEEFELYSNSFSHCSRKARLVLAELGIQAKHNPIDLIETGWYQTISPAYLKINPSGLVPTLVHNGHPVYESGDILDYAQSVAGPIAPQLVPDDPVLNRRMQEWLAFCSISSEDALANMESQAGSCIPALTLPMFVTSIQYIPLRRILIGFLFHFDKKRPLIFTLSKLLGLRRMMSLKLVRDMKDAASKHMTKHLDRLNTQLIEQGGDWVLGHDYSLADVSIGCMLCRLDETGWLKYFSGTGSLGAVLSYYERIKSRPSWDKAITSCAHPIISKAEKDLSDAVSASPAMAELIYGKSI